MADLVIDFASPVPVYEQLKRIIKYAIARGALVEGESLPSIRELASFLTINPNTVARAFRELTQSGVIAGRAGKGFWVNKSDDDDREKGKLLKEEFLKFLERAVAIGFTTDAIKKVIEEYFTEGERL